MALPDMRSPLLTVGATERPTAVATPVDQPRQSLVAAQTDGAWEGRVRAHSSGTVREDHLASLDITGCYEEPPAPLLLQNAVVHGESGEERIELTAEI